MSISRRTFLEGALVAGGVATAGMLAGCAGETEQKASTPSDAQAAKPTRDDIAVPHTTSERCRRPSAA